MRRIYLSGPMTGLEDYNYPAFHRAEAYWRSLGWDVENPANHFDGKQDMPRRAYLRKDFEELLKVDAIALLPGWSQADGALRELVVATGLGLEVYDARTGLPAPYDVSLIGVILEYQEARS